MQPVALARPLWWLALRSLRLLTGLVLLAVALGTGPGPTAVTATGARPVAVSSAVQGPTAVAALRPTLVTTPPGSGFRPAPRRAGTTEPAGADLGAERALPADRVDLLAAATARPAAIRPATDSRRISGDAHDWARGQRAPPRA
ncbi:hypothetical protein AB0J86_00535 [Micromonospora sp. NPDC049559]|uniref:hypothetical protein n=1 Tax=Micromonospora sp. NPDC049559 TaxID=3155923 RepID=UPI003441FC9D